MIRTLLVLCCSLAVFPAWAGGRESATGPADDRITPLIDHHQHLFSPALAALLSEPDNSFSPITAADLIGHLDEAGIKRAVVLSTAYIFSQPDRDVENEYDKVRAENEWTGQQVAKFPQRLIGFCSVSPLEDYALREIARCASDPRLRSGLKLHLANAEVDYHNPHHIERLRQVFQAANRSGMALIVHMRASVSPALPYGRDEARIFLDQVVTTAPDVPVQIAHLAGAGAYVRDPLADAALSVFIEAIADGDRRADRLWFDVTSVASAKMSPNEAEFLAARIRQLGIERVVYGSDAAVPGNPPHDGWTSFRRLPFTHHEFRKIANNVAPHAR